MRTIIDENIRKQVLERISPTEEEIQHQNRVISIIKRAISDRATEIHQSYMNIEPHGSTGIKQTQLRGAADIDLFIALSPLDYKDVIEKQPKIRRKELWGIFNNLVDSWFMPAMKAIGATDIRKTYSEHPYLSCVMDGLDIDIVSYFHLSREELLRRGPITAVDRTVHHSKYVVDNLTEQKRENVRILKSFVKACYTYGDTSAIGKNGFTGYALELISIDSNSLDDAFLKLFHLERYPIDPKKRNMKELKAIPAFRDDFVFIIDPTDLNRNVTSSLDRRSYNWTRVMIKKLETYLTEGKKDNALSLFLERPIPIEPPPGDLARNIRAFEFRSDESYHYTVVRDKLYHLGKKIKNKLMREPTGEIRFGQTIFELYFEKDVFALGFYVEHPEISEKYERKGPALHLKHAVEEFKRRNRNCFEKDGFVWALKKRRLTSAWNVVNDILDKNKIKGLSLVEQPGVVSARVLYVISKCILPMELHRERLERD